MNRKKERMFVLGIDGVPFSLLKSLCEQGVCENLSALISDNGMKPMNSVYPVISSVAWTGFATGVNPAQHGIFGFADRVASPFQITIPTSRHRKAVFVARSFDFGRKKRLQPPCAAISRFLIL